MGVWPVWVVYALAVARITGLGTRDTITDPLRLGIVRRLGARLIVDPDDPDPDQDTIVDWLYHAHPARWVWAKLITCQWCASIWIAGIASPLAYWHGDNPWLFLPAFALAMSQVTGMLSDLGRD